jgi:2-polyprenyl-6-methoxyphenol hydroxylase-like FAD-dependent oxidoreductase
MAQIKTTCCIVGGGPAGMMLGFLLARAGVAVAVLEKHKDFLRDFRGDTIHPSTLELMHELGLLDEFLKLPHSRVTRLSGQVGDTTIALADFSHLPTHCKFAALMPQWDFLDFLAAHGKKYAAFDLHMKTEATDLSRRMAASPVCAPRRRTASSRSAPILRSAATAAIRRCASAPVSTSRTSARRWTFSGSACRGATATPARPSAIWKPAACSS